MTDLEKQLTEHLKDLVRTASAPCELDAHCEECAVVMKSDHFAALMRANCLLVTLGELK